MIILLVEINDNFCQCGVQVQVQTTMPPTSIKSEAIQQPQKSDEEILLDYLLELTMVFPTDSKVKQALTDAGVQSIMDLFTMEIDLFSQLTYKVGTV